jgi:HAD superfamily hydrolase (TIGR01509 family)
MKDIDWVFFDIGGVLADESAYQEYRHSTCRAVARRYVKDVSQADYDRAYKEASMGVGSLTERVLRRLLENSGKSSQTEEALGILATEFRLGPSYLDMEEIRPEAQEVVARLAQCYRIGIIANQPEGIKAKLEAAGIMQCLGDCTLAGDRWGKPNPEYYREVLEKTGADPKRSIMVDDNLGRGVLPAKALGMTTIWFGTSIISQGADYSVESLGDLVPILLGV